jgi:predicted nucleic acid-binding protein
METRIKVLIDLNIILDVLQKRLPFYEASARVLAAVENGRLDGFVAAHSITTLFYWLAKTQSAQSARTIITDLLQFLSVAEVNQVTLEQALILQYEDFENAVQMMAAVRVGAEYVITRNPQDYRDGPIPAVQPAEFLPLIQ